jgi:hypothetical protein
LDSEALITISFDLPFIKTGSVVEPQLQARNDCEKSALAPLDEHISNLHRGSLSCTIAGHSHTSRNGAHSSRIRAAIPIDSSGVFQNCALLAIP